MSKRLISLDTRVSNINAILYVAKQVDLFADGFIEELHLYSSEDLAFVEMSLGLGASLGAITWSKHAKVAKAINHERDIVRGEDR